MIEATRVTEEEGVESEKETGTNKYLNNKEKVVSLVWADFGEWRMEE